MTTRTDQEFSLRPLQFASRSAAIVLAATTFPAKSHHGRGSYDAAKPITVTG
jgi:hypothetical protein